MAYPKYSQGRINGAGVHEGSDQNVGLSYGFDVQAPVPVSGREVVGTILERNALLFPYKGMRTFVESTGLEYRFLVDYATAVAQSGLGTPANNNAYWADVTSGGDAKTYLGAMFPSGGEFDQQFPQDYTTPGHVFAAGDLFIVGASGEFHIDPSIFQAGAFTPAEIASNTFVLVKGWHFLYDVQGKWALLRNETDLTTVDASNVTNLGDVVTMLLLANVLVTFIPGRSYAANQLVLRRLLEQSTQTEYTEIYQIQRPFLPADSLDDEDAATCVASQDARKLAYNPRIVNSAGVFSQQATPLDNGAGVLLDAKEIDRRIAVHGGGAGGGISTVNGGYATSTEADLGVAIYP